MAQPATAHPSIRTIVQVVTDKEDSVASPSMAWQRMADHFTLTDDLEDTKSMRDAKDRYLPQEDGEENSDYRARIDRSVLFPGFKDTVEKVVAKPFSRDVVVREEEKVGDDWGAVLKDVDLDGNSITLFAKATFRELVKRGCVHLFPNMPMFGQVQRGEMERRGIRPYLQRIAAPQLLGARPVMRDGKLVPTQLRIHTTEDRLIEGSAYREKTVEVITVINEPDVEGGQGTWERWEKMPNEKKFGLVEEGTHGLPELKLITLYANEEGYLEARPPYLDIAWLNVAHWQSMSDHRELSRYSRIRILAMYGFDKDQTVMIGGMHALRTESGPSDAKAEILQGDSTAQAISEGDVTKLEEKMAALGEQPFVQQTGNVTATGRAIDQANQQTDVQILIGTAEAKLLEAFEVMAELWGKELPTDFGIDIHSDFPLSLRSDADSKILTQTYLAGKLSYDLWFDEMKRRGVFAETADKDVERDAQRAQAQEALQFMQESMAGDEGDEDEEDEEEGEESPFQESAA